MNDEIFGLQATLATMQAEVSQYQKQSQQQEATIRQLQNEVSQANLQRTLLQEKLTRSREQEKNNNNNQSEQQTQPIRNPPSGAASASVSWPPPPIMAASSVRTSTSHEEGFPSSVIVAAASSTEASPSRTTPSLVDHPMTQASLLLDKHTSSFHNRRKSNQLSLGLYLSRTLLLANEDCANMQHGNNQSNRILQAMVWQKLDPAQDASLLSYLLEHSCAYMWQRMPRQPPQSPSNNTVTTRQPSSLIISSDSPLPWLYHALVFCQTRCPSHHNDDSSPLSALPQRQQQQRRPLRCRVVDGDRNVPPAVAVSSRLDGSWLPKRKQQHCDDSWLGVIPKELLQQTFQVLVRYAQVQMKPQDEACVTRDGDTNDHDMLYVLRMLALPAASMVELQADFANLLWEWTTRNLQSRIQTRLPSCPRRFVGLETTNRPASWPVLAAALTLGQRRRLNNTSTGATSFAIDEEDEGAQQNEQQPQQPWMRSIVGVTSDFVHFTLLPRFRLYRLRNCPAGTGGEAKSAKASLTDAVSSSQTPTTAVGDCEELAFVACQVVKMWQSWGTDCDWLRTQLVLPRKEEGHDAHELSSTSTRTHAPGIIQLACRLLQAIALEKDGIGNDANGTGAPSTWAPLQRNLLLFLGPIVVRHPAWFELSSRLEYTSALAHFKARGNSQDEDAMVRTCWASAQENDFMVG